MFIEKEGLLPLVEERVKLKNKLQKTKKIYEAKQKEIQEINAKLQEIQKQNIDVHLRFEEVNKQINKLVLLEVWDKCSATQMPDEVIVKDGKPFCKIIDFVDDITKQVQEARQNWEEQLKNN